MIDIHSEQITPHILSLFDSSKPTMPRAFNVLEGLNREPIVVDDPVHPIWAICVKQGATKHGGTAPGRTPSLKLARKLGYQREQEYRYVWWKANQV